MMSFRRTVREVEHCLIPLKDGTPTGRTHMASGGC